MRLKTVTLIAAAAAATLLLYEIAHGYVRQRDRQRVYAAAEAAARASGRPLLVIGDPHNGIGSRLYNRVMAGHGCGDVTVDLTGAPACPRGVAADALAYLRQQPSDSAVIFSSCVLEYIDDRDIDDLIAEMYRVSGGRVFIVSVSRYTISAYVYRDGTDLARRVVRGPPDAARIEYHAV